MSDLLRPFDQANVDEVETNKQLVRDSPTSRRQDSVLVSFCFKHYQAWFRFSFTANHALNFAGSATNGYE